MFRQAASRCTGRPADEMIDMAVVLLRVQGIISTIATVEVGLVAAATGGILVPGVILTASGAALSFMAARGLRHRSRRARRLAVAIQVLWLIAATIDLALALALAQRGLEIVPTLTRIVLPIAIFRILRRPQVRRVFGVRLSQRQRRSDGHRDMGDVELPVSETVPA